MVKFFSSFLVVFSALLLCNPVSSTAQDTDPSLHILQGYERYFTSNIPATVEAFSAEDFAAKIIQPKDSLSAEDKFIIGYMYRYGRGTSKDIIQAQKWYNRAVQDGHVPAMVELAKVYRAGPAVGAIRAINKARGLFRQAAEAGNAESWYEIALMYEAGNNVFQSFPNALSAYEKAAENGFYNAFVKLAAYHRHGIGTPQDLQKAIQYFAFMEQHEDDPILHPEITIIIGELLYEVAEQEDDIKVSLHWHKAAASKRHVPSMITIAKAFSDGLKIEEDYYEAAKWYEKAALRGHVGAMVTLGEIYGNGMGDVAMDLEKAFHWYLKAGEQGHKAAALYLGHAYEHGIGTEENLSESMKWYRRGKRFR